MARDNAAGWPPEIFLTYQNFVAFGKVKYRIKPTCVTTHGHSQLFFATRRNQEPSKHRGRQPVHAPLTFLSVALSSSSCQLTTVLSHAEVSGHVHATNATEPTPEPGDGNPNGIAPASSLKGRGKGARASESCEVPPTVSETSGSSRSGTGTSESDGGDDDSDAEQEEEGTSPEGGDGVGGKEMPGGNIWEGQLATRRSPERGGESFTPGVGNSRLDCLRGR